MTTETAIDIIVLIIAVPFAIIFVCEIVKKLEDRGW